MQGSKISVLKSPKPPKDSTWQLPFAKSYSCSAGPLLCLEDGFPSSRRSVFPSFWEEPLESLFIGMRIMSFTKNYQQNLKWRATAKSIWQRGVKDDPLIDGLRGGCIILIILFHSFYGVLFLLRKPEPILAFINRVPIWLSFGFAADKAVDIFFLVSAYLLGSSLFRAKMQGQKLDTREFYFKRLARIYPLFLLALTLYSFGNLKRSWNNLIYNLLFIDNFDFRSIIPVGWSLSIEMQFYAILPWLTALLFKLSEKTRPWLLWSLFAFSFLIQLAVCLNYPIIYQTPFFHFHPDKVDPAVMMDHLYYPTQTRFGPLVLGLLWAYFKTRKDLGNQVPTWLKLQGVQSILVVCGLALMWAMTFFPVYHPDTWFYRNFSPTLNLILHISHRNLFTFGLWLVMMSLSIGGGTSSVQNGMRKFLSWRVWRPFAQTVFPIYLFHFPMIALAGVTVFMTTDIRRIGTISVHQVFLIWAVASVYSLAFASVLHIWIEAPLMRMGYLWAGRSKRGVLKGEPSKETAHIGS